MNAYADWQRLRSCERKQGLSQWAANEVVLSAWKRGRNSRAYHCEHCGQWHVTRQAAAGTRP